MPVRDALDKSSMEVIEATDLIAVRQFLDHFHPMGCRGSLRGKALISALFSDHG